ncbi:MAG: DegT/DnrJ/EryC1/StrS aminotransferase family protein [Chitinispirillaceae bacterium]|nr:DegT/DnrJ/EryC1/StrS aminotransferase family protein [Chitinispirillaceae bacterium]
MKLNWPLMDNNITRNDLDVLVRFLEGQPRLTQSENVNSFEREWSQWVGVNYSVYVNSGASANLITMAALKHLYGGGEIIVPTLTWVSDIASVLQNGFTPVFVDINPGNLCMDVDQVIHKMTEKTRAVFITHVQGFNGLSDKLLSACQGRGIPLIEDVCESHGATFKGKKLGSFGLISNFSYYYAHHMSTVEGGMVCTNDEKIYETLRILRSHGMAREALSRDVREHHVRENPSLSPDFIFLYPAYNVRGTEIGAVLGRSQLPRLDKNILKRNANFKLFLDNLDDKKYFTDFDLEGSSNYAFNLILKNADAALRERLESALREADVEFRRGSSGGGNQLRQPYLRPYVSADECSAYPHVEHVHFFGYYIGNFPDLKKEKILSLCSLLNGLLGRTVI